MVRRRAAKARATKVKLNEAAIMAEIEANVRKKVKIYLTKQKRAIKYSGYNNKQEEK
jgi:hypothetical protein